MTVKPRRVLALATNPVEGASTRFRIEQWRHHLAAAGFDLNLDAFYSTAAARIMYAPGRSLRKLAHFAIGAARRVRALARAAGSADLILIHREAFPFGWRVLFDRLGSYRGPIVYDYDDAMFLPQRSGRGLLEWFERVDTPAEIMRLSHTVLAGNPFLAEYARRHARHVVLLPTCVDTSRFRPRARNPSSDGCVVGWIGSHSTVKYLEGLIPVLERVAARRGFELFVVGSPRRLDSRHVRIRQAPWTLDREVEHFQACDIGVYPLWDDDWSRGKSGFKAIQFMACGVPIVAAPIGVTCDIVQDGRNGFLAATDEEWMEKLARLLGDARLRWIVGDEGRRTVEERYSLDANAPLLIRTLRLCTDGLTAVQPGWSASSTKEGSAVL